MQPFQRQARNEPLQITTRSVHFLGRHGSWCSGAWGYRRKPRKPLCFESLRVEVWIKREYRGYGCGILVSCAFKGKPGTLHFGGPPQKKPTPNLHFCLLEGYHFDLGAGNRKDICHVAESFDTDPGECPRRSVRFPPGCRCDKVPEQVT